MIHNLLRRFRAWLVVGLARQKDLDNLYHQLAGLTQIVAGLRGDTILRPLRGWALSPDAIAWILADLEERVAPTVIEFGCGQSTIIFGHIVRRGGGRLISVEHDPEYAAEVRRQMSARGLAETVELHVYPLQQRKVTEYSTPCRSYPVEELPDIPVDLAIIDGPPMLSGEHTRFFPLRWALQHLGEGGAVYLDDAARPAEKEVLELIREEFPDVVFSELTAEKGLVMLKRRSLNSDSGSDTRDV